MKVLVWRILALAALVVSLGVVDLAWASDGVCTFPINFSDSQYTTCFTDVRRGADINDDGAPDLGGTGHTALNFTGGAGPAGDLWLTKWTPDGATHLCLAHTDISLGVNVLFHTYNNTKGAGLVALLDSAPGGKGLAVILYDQGNSDALQLATIDPATGQLTKLTSVRLGAAIAENAWYQIRATISASESENRLVVAAQVFRHSTPTNPGSPVAPVGPQLSFRSTLPTGLTDSGEIGLVASAFSTNVNASATNFTIFDCPEPL
jgi:hypothetical protein